MCQGAGVSQSRLYTVKCRWPMSRSSEFSSDSKKIHKEPRHIVWAWGSNCSWPCLLFWVWILHGMLPSVLSSGSTAALSREEEEPTYVPPVTAQIRSHEQSQNNAKAQPLGKLPNLPEQASRSCMAFKGIHKTGLVLLVFWVGEAKQKAICSQNFPWNMVFEDEWE